MTDDQFLNLVTYTINSKIERMSYPKNQVKYPNTDIDIPNLEEYVEILITPYTGKKINLKGDKRCYGCVTVKVLTARSIGANRAVTLAQDISESLSQQIISGVVFDQYDLKILDHTLSQTQTTTQINDFQVNSNIDYSYTR